MEISDTARAEMEAHRRRYDALKQAGTGAAPQALPPATEIGAVPVDPDAVIAQETVPGGWYTAMALKRHETLRLVNTDGSASVALLAFNAADTSERLNHADTMKIQWSARIRKGRVIFSDMGRVILSVTEDTSGAHDALAGGSTAASTLAAFGPGPYRNTRDNLVQAALKVGLSRRDIGPFVSFFAPVCVGADGGLLWRDGVRRAGDFVDLRAEMDLVVLLSNAPHPLDPARPYAPGRMEAIRLRGRAPGKGDLCRTASAEAVRGFENTFSYIAV